jgi:hypothetical protein
MGLREQIKNASSESEISSLLAKGNSFEFASEHTKHAWKSTAKVRLMSLTSTSAVQTSAVQTTEKEIVTKKTPKKKKDKVG